MGPHIMGEANVMWHMPLWAPRILRQMVSYQQVATEEMLKNDLVDYLKLRQSHWSDLLCIKQGGFTVL